MAYLCGDAGGVGLREQLSDDGRQWKTVQEDGTVGVHCRTTVGHCRTLSDCRTVGLSDCRTSVGQLSDHCRITVSEFTVGLSDRARQARDDGSQAKLRGETIVK
jgi:hypothetical protein